MVPVARPSVSFGPVSIAINSMTNKIYVVNGTAGPVNGSVTIIDGATNATTDVALGLARCERHGPGLSRNVPRTQTLTPVYQVDASGNVTAQPIGIGSDEVYLIVFATGVRNARSVVVTVGGISIPVLFAGAQGYFAGEDQVNVGPLPRSLGGAGSVDVTVVADGAAANVTHLSFR